MKKYVLFLFILIFLPFKVLGISIFTPFGGQVESYNPAPSGCVSAITMPTAAATAFTVWITVEKIEVGQPKPATLGFLRINLAPVMPFLSNWKSNYIYMVPGTYVLGNSFNLCDVCGQIEKIADKVSLNVVKNICDKIKGLDKILKYVCSVAADVGDCPINNLIYQIGSGMPSGGLEGGTKVGFSYVSEMICKTILKEIPLIGQYLSNICGYEEK